MRKLVAVVSLVCAAAGWADTTYVTIGAPAGGNVVPFYGEVCDAMRFQQLYPQPDLNVAGRIVSVAVYDWGDLQGYFYDAHVRLCATRTNQLASEFHANYGGNEPTVVFSNPSLRVANGQSQTWFPFVCSAPFFYLNRDNLLVEVTWHGDNGHNVGLYKTGTGGGGRVWANSDSATIGQGEPSENMYARVGFLPFRLTGSLLSPNGGETWPGESSRVFVWTVTPKNFQFGRLLLSTDNGATFPTVLVSSVLPTDTAHAVALPQVNSDRCRARFEAFDSTEEPALVAESESSFTIDSDEPSSPILAFPPSGGAMNSQSITFRWHQAYDSLSGVAHYTIQVAYDSAFATLVDTARRTDTSYARTLPGDTSYFWRVRATDRCGNVGQWSQKWKFEIDIQTPAVPTLLEPPDRQWFTVSGMPPNCWTLS